MKSEGWRHPEVVDTTLYLTSGTDVWTPSFRPTGQDARTSVSGGTDETLLVGPLVIEPTSNCARRMKT